MDVETKGIDRYKVPKNLTLHYPLQCGICRLPYDGSLADTTCEGLINNATK